MNPPSAPPTEPPLRSTLRKIGWSTISIHVVEFVPIMLFSSLVLDGGQMMRCFMTAALGYWVGLLIVLIRRRNRATPGDFAYVVAGYPIAALMTFLVAPSVAGICRQFGWQGLQF